MKRDKLLNPFSMLASGFILGVAARLFDIYCPNLGEIFSQMSVWILFGTLITVYSPTKKAAMWNIFPFCIGMLLTYYATTMLTKGVYGWSFIITTSTTSAIPIWSNGTLSIGEASIGQCRYPKEQMKHRISKRNVMEEMLHET